MTTEQFKQRVAIAKTERGVESFITVEWLRMLKARFAEVSTTTETDTTTTVDSAALAAVAADLSALTSRVTTLELQSTDYESRLRALEGGYEA